jgi:hypothetical protein
MGDVQKKQSQKDYSDKRMTQPMVLMMKKMEDKTQMVMV